MARTSSIVLNLVIAVLMLLMKLRRNGPHTRNILSLDLFWILVLHNYLLWTI